MPGTQYLLNEYLDKWQLSLLLFLSLGEECGKNLPSCKLPRVEGAWFPRIPGRVGSGRGWQRREGGRRSLGRRGHLVGTLSQSRRSHQGLLPTERSRWSVCSALCSLFLSSSSGEAPEIPQLQKAAPHLSPTLLPPPAPEGGPCLRVPPSPSGASFVFLRFVLL